MEENKDNTFGIIEKLALIAESVQTLFSGKGTIVFELPKVFILDEKDKS